MPCLSQPVFNAGRVPSEARSLPVRPTIPLLTWSLSAPSNGTLTALSSTSGKPQSTLRYGSPILGIATVLKAVFVTSANGELSFARNYGQKGAGFDTQGSITTPPVVVDGAAYVGNSNGSFYAVTPYGAAPL